MVRYSTSEPKATAQGSRVAANDLSGLLLSVIDLVAATVETNPPIDCKTGFGGMALFGFGSHAGIQAQISHAFDVLGMGEHIQRHYLLQPIDPIGAESVQIPG